jgi:hypothetical protein
MNARRARGPKAKAIFENRQSGNKRGARATLVAAIHSIIETCRQPQT